MQDQTNWKPSVAEMREWGSREHWPDHYFRWLQGMNPLPAIPDNCSMMFDALRSVLIKVHGLETDCLELFHAGEFASLFHAEVYDPYEAYCRAERHRKIARGRAMVEEMLRYQGAITPETIDHYIGEIERTFPDIGCPTA